MSTNDDEKFMREALAEARAAASVGEVPIGAVVVCDGRVVARAHNRRELDQDPAAHAEFAAISAAARELARWRLSDCTVYVTLEPCCMCAGLMVNARIGRCVYGASDAKAGALGSLYHLQSDGRLNHSFSVTAGVLADECSGILKAFFASVRQGRDLALDAHAAHASSLAAAPVSSADDGVHLGEAEQPVPRALLAMDSFKGSATSAQVEAWTAEGVARACPAATVVSVPLADGGEGTIDAFASGLGGSIKTRKVEGPLGRAVRARYLSGDEHDTWAVIEMAEAAGIGYSSCSKGDALKASTYGVGELVLDAVAHGAKRLYVGLGGSATNDGGAGMLQALGAHLLDAEGNEVGRGLAGLKMLSSVDLTPAVKVLRGVEITLLSDVDNPLVGKRGALAVFGPQKGLPAPGSLEQRIYDSWMIAYGRLLDQAMVARDAGSMVGRRFRSVLGVPGAGAAGGLGAAFLALGATVRSGVDVLLDAVGFDDLVDSCDLVITGEGHMDTQTAGGKAPVGVARRAKKHHKPVVAVVGGRSGNLDAVYDAGIDVVLPSCRAPMALDRATTPGETRANLVAAGETAARIYLLGRRCV